MYKQTKNRPLISWLPEPPTIAEWERACASRDGAPVIRKHSSHESQLRCGRVKYIGFSILVYIYGPHPKRADGAMRFIRRRRVFPKLNYNKFVMEGNVHNYIYRVHLSKATSLRMVVYTYLCMYQPDYVCTVLYLTWATYIYHLHVYSPNVQGVGRHLV